MAATVKMYPESDDFASGGGGGGSGGGGGGTTTSGGSTGETYVANCDTSLVEGQSVRLEETSPGQFNAVAVDIMSLNTSPADGIISKKYSATLCAVAVSGVVDGVFSSLVPGVDYFVSPSGIPARLPMPSLPAGGCYQRMGRALSSSGFMVKAGAGPDIVKTSIN